MRIKELWFNNHPYLKTVKKQINLVWVLLLGFLLTQGCACSRIDAGHEGIEVHLTSSEKGVDDIALVTGWQFYNPFFTSIYEFPTFVQTVDYESFTVNAKDGSVFTVDPTISIKIIDGHSPAIFRKYRTELGNILKTTIYNYVKDAFRIQFNTFTTDSVISNRAEFERNIQTMLDTSLSREGFKLEQLTSGMQYPPSIVDAITAKNKAIQDAMKVQNELVSAEATAKIKLTEARAEAESYRLKQQALNPLLIQQMFIEKWDGKLPVYGQTPQIFKDISK